MFCPVFSKLLNFLFWLQSFINKSYRQIISHENEILYAIGCNNIFFSPSLYVRLCGQGVVRVSSNGTACVYDQEPGSKPEQTNADEKVVLPEFGIFTCLC